MTKYLKRKDICKQILVYLETTPLDVTQAILQKALDLSKTQVDYALKNLRKHNLVNESQVLGNMRTKHISINDSTIARLSINGVIHNV